MNNSIYIAQNNNDIIDFNIPAFDTGAISTAINTPVSTPVEVEEEVHTNSTFLLSFIFVSFIVCIILAFLFRKKNVEVVNQTYSTQNKTRREYNNESKNDYIPQEKQEKTSLYRHSSNRKTSLSTPTSINKCIRAFLENTIEN